MTKDEALKMALEALEVATTPLAKDRQEVLRARAAIREALAQPEQEPVAHTTGHCENHKQKGGCQLHNLQCGWPDCDRKPITHPPQRKPLTDEEIEAIHQSTWMQSTATLNDFARAIEAAHGIKGET